MSEPEKIPNPLGDPNGGKYDEIAQDLQHHLDAAGVLVIVVDGNRGSGFSVCGTKTVITSLVGILRFCAEQMERQALERDPLNS
jgi:hypothetical protein